MTSSIHPAAEAEMLRGTRQVTITYRGASAAFEMPGWYPEGSDDGLHSQEDMKVSDRELNELKARVEGLLGPSEIRRIRKKLGLTQRDAGWIIGGGPNAFQKYESGEVLASRAVSNLLRVLARHPDEVARLRREREEAAA